MSVQLSDENSYDGGALIIYYSGEQYIAPAKQFIEAIHAKFEEFHGYKDPEIMDNQAPEELEDIRHLAGI